MISTIVRHINHKFFYHDIIESIVAALEAKDKYTADHSSRVGDMADKLCKCLGIGGSRRYTIHIAAHLHDIGKIGVPDTILNKDGHLLEEEWAYIKQHPKIGYDILSKSLHLNEIKKIVLHHHERWDGLGYPGGLSGEHIPLGSRIVAICDSVDAMRSKRAYRTPMKDEDCKEELRKNISIMYDPIIVKCFLENWDNIVIKTSTQT